MTNLCCGGNYNGTPNQTITILGHGFESKLKKNQIVSHERLIFTW